MIDLPHTLRTQLDAAQADNHRLSRSVVEMTEQCLRAERERNTLREQVDRVTRDDRNEASAPYYGESGRAYADGWNAAMECVKRELG